MCVILVCDKVRPEPEMVQAAFEANRDGAGIAWRQDGKIHWRKGMNMAESLDMCATVPLPFVFHTRISTVGGTPQQLCHPFPIDKRTTNDLTGSTTNPVLFHNGHWSDWNRDMKEVALKSGVHLPPGKWSDSRAMAWCASVFGLGFLDLLDQKIAVMGTKQIVMYGGPWALVNDIVVSNRGWETRYVTLKRESEKKSSGEQQAQTSSDSPASRKHGHGCFCVECLPPKHHSGPIGVVADPFERARAKYLQALAAYNEAQANRLKNPQAVSKNRLKALRREMEATHYQFKKATERHNTQALLESPRLLH